MKSDDNEHAESELKKEIALEPNLPDAYEQLGELYLKMNRYDDAEKALHQALRLNPKMPASLFGLAKINMQREQVSAGAQRNRRRVATCSRQPERFTLCEVEYLLKLGRREEAEKELLISKNMLDAAAAKETFEPSSMDDNRVRNPELERLRAAVTVLAYAGILPRRFVSCCHTFNRSGATQAPRAASILSATASTNSSSYGRPITCTPIGKPFRRHPQRHRRSWKSSEIRPLAEPHRVAITMWRAQLIISLAMTKRRLRRNRRKQNRHIAHLPQNLCAQIVAIRACRQNRVGAQRLLRQRRRKVFLERSG